MKSKLLLIITLVTLLSFTKSVFSQAPPLGNTSNFALFTAAGAFTNTGTTEVTGDIGSNVGGVTGFPPGIVNGTIHTADPITVLAAMDVDAAYTFMGGITCGTVIGTTLGNGQILTPDVYCLGAASTLNGDLTFDGQGNPNSIFIIKIDGALTTSTLSNVFLLNSASLNNIYWQINGEFTLGGGSVFRGTLITNGAITLLEASSLLGRGLSRGGAITLQNNAVSLLLPPVASIITANGPTTFCEGGNVILSGNVDGVWSNGAVTPSITVTTSGDYYVTNTNGFESVNSNHIIVTSNPLPFAITGQNATICNGNSITLGAASIGGHTYVWTPSTGLNSATISNPTASPTITTTYTLTETITATSCQNSNSVTLTVNDPPNITVEPFGVISCVGSSASFSVTATGTGLTYQWRLGNTNLSDGGNISGVNTPTLTINPVSIANASATYNVVVTGTCIPALTSINVSLVVDNAPSLTCPSNITQNTDPAMCNAFVTVPLPGTQNTCGISSIINNYNSTNNASGIYPVGVTLVNWTATDIYGNTATCQQTLTITDITPPTISCPANQVIGTDPGSCFGTILSLGDPIVSDNCTTVFVTHTQIVNFSIGTTIINWIATDLTGNSSVCQQSVVVIDQIVPSVTCPIDMTVLADAGQCYASNVYLGSPTSSDNCSVFSVINNAPVNLAVGNNTIQWIVTDGAGNTASCFQNVLVTELNPPTIQAPADLIVSTDPGECYATGLSLGNPTVYDQCTTPVISNNAPNIYPIGATIIDWTATDQSGNTSRSTQTVTVVDNEHPQIICPLNMVVPGNTFVQISGPQVSDNCGIASITNDFNGTDNASGNYPPGSTNVIFTVTDIHGNTSTCNTIITIDCELIAQNDYFNVAVNSFNNLVVTSNDILCGLPILCNNVTILHQSNYISFFVEPVTGQITYIPMPGFTGVDSMQYEVCCEITTIDDAGISTTAWVCNSAWVYVHVFQPPTAHIAGSTFICTDGFANLVLTMTGIPPYTLWVFDGTTTTIYSGITSNYFNIEVHPNITTTYTITQVQDATTLTAVGTGSATITVFGPEAYIVTGGGSFCPGTTGLPIGLTGSEIGIVYTLYLNGSVISDPVSGTGNPLNFGLYNLPGVYTAVAVSPQYNCTYPMYSNAVVTILPAPVAYAVTGGGSCCFGCTDIHVGLSQSDQGVYYQLYLEDTILVTGAYGTGGALDFGYVTESGNYTVVGINGYGCYTEMTGQAVAIIWPRPDGNLVSLDQTICLGNSGQLVIDILAGTAPWCVEITNGTTITKYCDILCSPFILNLSPTQTTTYTMVSIKDTNNCMGFFQGSTTINVLPVPTANLGFLNPICLASDPIILSGGMPLGGSYSGNGVIGGIFYPANVGAGTFQISYTNVNMYGCIASAISTITVNPSPDISFTTMDPIYCINDPAFLLIGNLSPQGSFAGTGIINNGNGTAFFNPNVAGVGNHTISYIYNTGNCYGSVQQTIYVTGAPDEFQVTGGGGYCSGAQGVEVGLSGSQLDVMYQLIINGSNTSTFISGTGYPISFGIQTIEGIYIIRAFGTGNYCQTTMNGSAYIFINQLPIVTLSPFAPICLNSNPLVLSGGYPLGGNFVGPGVSDNIFYPSLTGAGTFNIAYIFSGIDQCSNFAIQQITVNTCQTFGISGYVTYKNTSSTPMNNVVVTLKQNSNTIATTTTNQSGFYQFNGLNNGTFDITGGATLPWGGANSADALLIMKHFTGTEYLNDINETAGDVDNQHSINATDALLVVRRFVNLINYFPAGDWTFERPHIVINSTDLSYDFKALSFGDVNGSYLPPSARITPSMNLNASGTIDATTINTITLPIRVANEQTVASLSLIMNYPSDYLEVTSVQVSGQDNGEIQYNTEGDQLRISWYNLTPLKLQPNNDFLWLHFRIRDLTKLINNNIELSLEEASEVSDISGQTINGVNLTYPKINFPNNSFSVQVYPNPLNDKAEFVYSIPEDAKVTLMIYDILGNEVKILSDGIYQKAGTYQTTFDALALPQGVYNYKLVVHGNHEQQKTGRLVIAH